MSKKPYEVPLEPELAQEILSMPISATSPFGIPEGPPVTIGERVERATQAVRDANQYLATSKLASLVAHSLMKDLKKRGNPSIVVQPDGSVILRVSYGEDKQEAPEAPVKKSKWSSDLPKLDELRAEAERLGVDISSFGRARRTIFEHLKKVRGNSEDEDAPPGRMSDEVKETEEELGRLPRR